jgi:catechol 2,3-dioxygenase-like lactoylglutathione lyase family enzyme
MMIDHTGVNVADLKASKRFYAAALAPLGYKLLLEFHGSVAGFGERGKPDFWVARGEPNTPRVHVAFRADTRQRSQRSMLCQRATHSSSTAVEGRSWPPRACLGKVWL